MNENNIEKYIDETEADDTIRYETMDAGDAADDDTAAADDEGFDDTPMPDEADDGCLYEH